MSLLSLFKPKQEPKQELIVEDVEEFAITRAAGGYNAAESDRLTDDWQVSSISANQAINAALVIMRDRSRDLERNNSYVKHYFELLSQNVVGEHGIRLQAQAKNANGQIDVRANKKIEASFNEWAQAGNCTVCGKYSWRNVQDMVLHADRQDGEALVRMVKGFGGNKWRFALQLLESDHLDIDYINRRLPNGNQVYMGVEVNQWLRPIAYHILAAHPGDGTYLYNGKYRYRIPAEEILHIYTPSRPEQLRGVPHLHTVMQALNMLDGFQEAELVKARMAACIGIIVQREHTGASPPDSKGVNNQPQWSVEPGMKIIGNPGEIFKEFAPNTPNSGIAAFKKAVLQEVSGGIEMAYNTLSNDLESVNFSSIRSGKLQEQKKYRCLQSMLVEKLCRPVYGNWLGMALLTDLIGLRYQSYNRYLATKWMGQGFPWVDPRADMIANTKAIDYGLTTRTDVLAAQGQDFEEVVDKLEYEEARIKAAGLTLGDFKKHMLTKGGEVDAGSKEERTKDTPPKAK
jgi:lambda family phage portal protein